MGDNTVVAQTSPNVVCFQRSERTEGVFPLCACFGQERYAWRPRLKRCHLSLHTGGTAPVSRGGEGHFKGPSVTKGGFRHPPCGRPTVLAGPERERARQRQPALQNCRQPDSRLHDTRPDRQTTRRRGALFGLGPLRCLKAWAPVRAGWPRQRCVRPALVPPSGSAGASSQDD